MSSRFIITLSCPDRPGIVAALSHVLAENGFNITESQQYSDLESGQFFMRVACEGAAAKDRLSAELDPLAARTRVGDAGAAGLGLGGLGGLSGGVPGIGADAPPGPPWPGRPPR